MNLPIALNQAGRRRSGPAGNQQCGTQPVPILMVGDDVRLCQVMQAVLGKEGFALAIENTVASGVS